MSMSFIFLHYNDLFIRKLHLRFIVLLSLDADVLHYIETELQTHYKNIKIDKQKEWKEGDVCIARYHQNRKWYRGRVIKISRNSVKVKNNNLSFLTVIFELSIVYSVSRWNLSITVTWKIANWST